MSSYLMRFEQWIHKYSKTLWLSFVWFQKWCALKKYIVLLFIKFCCIKKYLLVFYYLNYVILKNKLVWWTAIFREFSLKHREMYPSIFITVPLLVQQATIMNIFFFMCSNYVIWIFRKHNLNNKTLILNF